MQCPYVQVPCTCSDEGCKRTVARGEAPDGRTNVHQESDPEVRCCCRFPLHDGLIFVRLFQSDSARIVTCEFCGDEFPKVSAMGAHLESSCPEKMVTCDQAENGCTWKGPRLSLNAHLGKCVYESIKGFFAIHKTEMSQLSKHNERLRRRTEELEGAVRILKQELEWAKIALGPWYRPVYTERPHLTTNYAQNPNGEGPAAGQGPSRVRPMLSRGMDPMTGGISHPLPRVENGATEVVDFFDPFSFIGQTRNHDRDVHPANNASTTTGVINAGSNPSIHTSGRTVESGDSHDLSVDTTPGSGPSNGLETIQNANVSVSSPGTSNLQTASTPPSATLFPDHFPSENQVGFEEGGLSSQPRGWRHALPPNSMLSNPSPGTHPVVSIPILATCEP